MAATRICPQCGTETQASFCRVDGFATVDATRYAMRDHGRREGDAIGGRYRLDQLVARTSVGWTYRATDLRLHAAVAVRLLAPTLASDLGLVARFQRQGRLVASLAHPNIVHVLEHGVDEDGTLFIAEELVVGPTLAEALARSGPFEAARVVTIARELFDALAEAQAHGVLHRSLGLDNVVLVPRPGGGETIKVGDFGLVQVLADDTATAFVFPPVLTHAWATMAPEQARGRGVSGHADVYSAGALMYALLAGRPVFQASAPSDLLVAHSVRMPAPIEREGRILAGPLVDLIMRCLEKKPWNRPDGAQKALDMLEQCRVQPVLPVALSTAEFAAPSAGVTVATTRPSKRPATNPYGPRPEPRPIPAAVTDVPTSPATDGAGAVRPGRPARRLVTTSPEITAVAAPRITDVPITPAARASDVLPGASAARAEALDRGFATRRRDWDEPAPRRSPVLWFVAGVVVAGLIAAAGVVLWFGGWPGSQGASHGAVGAADLPPQAEGAASPGVEAAGLRADALAVEPAAAPAAPAVPVAATSDAATNVASDAGPGEGVALAAEGAGPETDAPQAPDAGALAGATPGDTAADAQGGADAGGAAAGVRVGDAGDAAAVASEVPKDKKPRPARERRVDDPLADLEDPEFRGDTRVSAPPEVRHSVLVESEPVGAGVSLGGRVLGVTPIYVEWSGTDSVGVVVEKVGYRPAHKRLGPSTGRAIRVTLEPEP